MGPIAMDTEFELACFLYRAGQPSDPRALQRTRMAAGRTVQIVSSSTDDAASGNSKTPYHSRTNGYGSAVSLHSLSPKSDFDAFSIQSYTSLSTENSGCKQVHRSFESKTKTSGGHTKTRLASGLWRSKDKPDENPRSSPAPSKGFPRPIWSDRSNHESTSRHRWFVHPGVRKEWQSLFSSQHGEQVHSDIVGLAHSQNHLRPDSNGCDKIGDEPQEIISAHAPSALRSQLRQSPRSIASITQDRDGTEVACQPHSRSCAKSPRSTGLSYCPSVQRSRAQIRASNRAGGAKNSPCAPSASCETQISLKRGDWQPAGCTERRPSSANTERLASFFEEVILGVAHVSPDAGDRSAPDTHCAWHTPTENQILGLSGAEHLFDTLPETGRKSVKHELLPNDDVGGRADSPQPLADDREGGRSYMVARGAPAATSSAQSKQNYDSRKVGVSVPQSATLVDLSHQPTASLGPECSNATDRSLSSPECNPEIAPRTRTCNENAIVSNVDVRQVLVPDRQNHEQGTSAKLISRRNPPISNAALLLADLSEDHGNLLGLSKLGNDRDWQSTHKERSPAIGHPRREEARVVYSEEFSKVRRLESDNVMISPLATTQPLFNPESFPTLIERYCSQSNANHQYPSRQNRQSKYVSDLNPLEIKHACLSRTSLSINLQAAQLKQFAPQHRDLPPTSQGIYTGFVGLPELSLSEGSSPPNSTRSLPLLNISAGRSQERPSPSRHRLEHSTSPSPTPRAHDREFDRQRLAVTPATARSLVCPDRYGVNEDFTVTGNSGHLTPSISISTDTVHSTSGRSSLVEHLVNTIPSTPDRCQSSSHDSADMTIPVEFEYRRRADSLTDRVPASSTSSSSFDTNERAINHGKSRRNGERRRLASSSRRTPSSTATSSRNRPGDSASADPWGMIVVNAVPHSPARLRPSTRSGAEGSRPPQFGATPSVTSSRKKASARPATSAGHGARPFGSSFQPVPVSPDASFLPAPTVRAEKRPGFKARLKGFFDPRKKQAPVEYDSVLY
ncbi:unnamed protein product [Sympodiomycopsis kandeliae]